MSEWQFASDLSARGVCSAVKFHTGSVISLVSGDEELAPAAQGTVIENCGSLLTTEAMVSI
jgi:hypothetical protein